MENFEFKKPNIDLSGKKSLNEMDEDFNDKFLKIFGVEFSESGLSIEDFLAEKIKKEKQLYKLEKENNCENCKHWGQLIIREFRRCLKSKMADSPMYSGCGLNTKKDFGCKLFEEKEYVRFIDHEGIDTNNDFIGIIAKDLKEGDESPDFISKSIEILKKEFESFKDKNGLLDSVKLVNKEDLTDDFKDNYLGGNS